MAEFINLPQAVIAFVHIVIAPNRDFFPHQNRIRRRKMIRQGSPIFRVQFGQMIVQYVRVPGVGRRVGIGWTEHRGRVPYAVEDLYRPNIVGIRLPLIGVFQHLIGAAGNHAAVVWRM